MLCRLVHFDLKLSVCSISLTCSNLHNQIFLGQCTFPSPQNSANTRKKLAYCIYNQHSAVSQHNTSINITELDNQSTHILQIRVFTNELDSRLHHSVINNEFNDSDSPSGSGGVLHLPVREILRSCLPVIH